MLRRCRAYWLLRYCHQMYQTDGLLISLPDVLIESGRLFQSSSRLPFPYWSFLSRHKISSSIMSFHCHDSKILSYTTCHWTACPQHARLWAQPTHLSSLTSIFGLIYHTFVPTRSSGPRASSYPSPERMLHPLRGANPSLLPNMSQARHRGHKNGSDWFSPTL